MGFFKDQADRYYNWRDDREDRNYQRVREMNAARSIHTKAQRAGTPISWKEAKAQGKEQAGQMAPFRQTTPAYKMPENVPLPGVTEIRREDVLRDPMLARFIAGEEPASPAEANQFGKWTEQSHGQGYVVPRTDGQISNAMNPPHAVTWDQQQAAAFGDISAEELSRWANGEPGLTEAEATRHYGWTQQGERGTAPWQNEARAEFQDELSGEAQAAWAYAATLRERGADPAEIADAIEKARDLEVAPEVLTTDPVPYTLTPEGEQAANSIPAVRPRETAAAWAVARTMADQYGRDEVTIDDLHAAYTKAQELSGGPELTVEDIARDVAMVQAGQDWIPPEGYQPIGPAHLDGRDEPTPGEVGAAWSSARALTREAEREVNGEYVSEWINYSGDPKDSPLVRWAEGQPPRNDVEAAHFRDATEAAMKADPGYTAPGWYEPTQEDREAALQRDWDAPLPGEEGYVQSPAEKEWQDASQSPTSADLDKENERAAAIREGLEADSDLSPAQRDAGTRFLGQLLEDWEPADIRSAMTDLDKLRLELRDPEAATRRSYERDNYPAGAKYADMMGENFNVPGTHSPEEMEEAHTAADREFHDSVIPDPAPWENKGDRDTNEKGIHDFGPEEGLEPMPDERDMPPAQLEAPAPESAPREPSTAEIDRAIHERIVHEQGKAEADRIFTDAGIKPGYWEEMSTRSPEELREMADQARASGAPKTTATLDAVREANVASPDEPRVRELSKAELQNWGADPKAPEHDGPEGNAEATWYPDQYTADREEATVRGTGPGVQPAYAESPGAAAPDSPVIDVQREAE